MADALERRIIEILQTTLHDNGVETNVLITGEDSMDTISGWDSLRFMSVFVAINEAFGLNPDFDDASTTRL